MLRSLTRVFGYPCPLAAAQSTPSTEHLMDANTRDATFIDEVSAFLNSTEVYGPQLSESSRDIEAGTPNIDSSQDRGRIATGNPVLKQVLRKKRYERRLRDERDTLRDMVGELTSRLEQLRRGHTSKQLGTVADADAVYSSWRALAMAQREQRQRVEQVQSRLEAAIDDQATYLETLRALVPTHLYDWVALTAATRAAIVSSRQNNMQANHILFADHLRQVFAAYVKVDEIFRDTDESTLAGGMAASVRRAETDDGVEYFRHFNKCKLPFGFKHTSDAWWELTNLNQWLQDGDGYGKLADPNETVILRVRLVRTLPTGVTVSVVQRYILRRFVAETRTVFMWKSYSEGEGILAGTYVEETGWACLQPSIEDASTEVRVCVHQVPMQLGGPRASTANAQKFYGLMQTLLKENAQVMMGLLSKKLLEETLAPIDITV
ncbi:hypothetical protein PHYPSEUDO_002079 [Phytophthora pseudosyringae]|uniref:M96 mating-specific protein family n=1 Tax=Phytophthora pseudosyringae TaxID=221518 RepID=A0A8T1VYC9_9STRA|nr:hypothetical protein PHYPSEUDO_002079 [Phytophthora pseudosyringae]